MHPSHCAGAAPAPTDVVLRRSAALAARQASASAAVAPDIVLVTPDSPAQLDATRAIFREYAAGLGVDLCFQNFDAELAALARRVRARRAAAAARAASTARSPAAARCRPIGDVDYANACEMKRLYVRPAFRGLGLGRLIAQALMDQAMRAGYSVMLLDTLDDMEAARGLYAAARLRRDPAVLLQPDPGRALPEGATRMTMPSSRTRP